MFDYQISSRLPLQILCGVFLLSLFAPFFRTWLVSQLQKFESRPASNGWQVAGTIAIVYFMLAVACKYSQLNSHLLTGADFWLFEDMLKWMSQGQPYVTRFTGHDIGPVQHGSVHAFLTMFLLMPFVWLFGSEFTAIIMNPLGLTCGGLAIGLLAFRWTQSRTFSAVATVSFLASSWTGRILMYDCHPEAFYPLLIVGAAATLDNSFLINRWRWLLMILAVAALAGMKQDALVISAVVLLNAVVVTKLRFKPAAYAAVVLLVISMLMTGLMKEFRTGSVGARSVQIGKTASNVSIAKTGTVALGGKQLTGFSDLKAIFDGFLQSHGGVAQTISASVMYLVKPPYLMICLIAPWLWIGGLSFWILMMPLGLIYGLLGGFMVSLPIYHSAPALGLIYLGILTNWRLNSSRTQTRKFGILLWLLAISAFHGASGLIYFHPSQYSKELSTEARVALPLGSSLGIVSSRLLSDIDHDRVWSDRPVFNGGTALPASVSWILFPRDNESFDFNIVGFQTWKKASLESGEWKLVEGKLVDLMVRADSLEAKL